MHPSTSVPFTVHRGYAADEHGGGHSIILQAGSDERSASGKPPLLRLVTPAEALAFALQIVGVVQSATATNMPLAKALQTATQRIEYAIGTLDPYPAPPSDQ